MRLLFFGRRSLNSAAWPTLKMKGAPARTPTRGSHSSQSFSSRINSLTSDTSRNLCLRVTRGLGWRRHRLSNRSTSRNVSSRYIRRLWCKWRRRPPYDVQRGNSIRTWYGADRIYSHLYQQELSRAPLPPSLYPPTRNSCTYMTRVEFTN